MGRDVYWWFWEVREAATERAELACRCALEEVQRDPEVPSLLASIPRLFPGPGHSSVDAGRAAETRYGLDHVFLHPRLARIAAQIVRSDDPVPSDSLLGASVGLSRTAPTVVLWYGLGAYRASQLPGFLGHMFISHDRVAETLASVKRVLDVEWSSFYQTAKLCLDYGGFEDDATKEVRTLLGALPAALETVQRRGSGLIATQATNDQTGQ